MGRAPCYDKASVKKGPWSPQEDAKLKDYMDKNGTGGNWIALPQKAGLRRCGKSCRLRWLNYLRPNIKHGEFSDDEDRIICTLFASIGSRWSIIAAQLPGRTDNDIKNYWNTKLKKKLFGRVQSQTKPHQNQIHHATSTLLYNCSNNTYQTPATSFSCFGPPYSSTFSNTSASCLTATSILQPQPQESLVGPVQHYQLHDNNGVRIFGGEASCCSSSDGSCSNIQTSAGNNRELEYSDGDHHQQVGIHSYDNFYSDEGQKLIMASDSDHGADGWSGHQKSLNGLWGETETPLDYGIEEIKQLISTTSSCNSFVFDENKADENVMYY